MLATVLQIAHQFAGILDIEPLTDLIAQQTKTLLGYRAVALLLVEGDMRPRLRAWDLGDQVRDRTVAQRQLGHGYLSDCIGPMQSA